MTRADTQATPLVERLRKLGAEVFAYATIAIRPPEDLAPLDDAVRNLEAYDWVVFTSSNAVDSVADRRSQVSADPGAFGLVRVAAVGAATCRALTGRGIGVDCVAERFTSAALVEAMGDVRALRVLLPRSDLAQPPLPDGLRARGANVHEVVAYRTVPADDITSWAERIDRDAVDAIVFTSPSTARYFLDGLRTARTLDRVFADGTRPAIICIGPTTAGAVRELTGRLAADVVAETHDEDGLVDAIVRWSGAHAGRTSS